MNNTKNVPEIRFKGCYDEDGNWIAFTHPWEQRKLGDISESYSGGTPTAGKKEYYDGDIPFIRSGEISGDKTELFITDEGLNNSSAKMVKIGDILYALYGATSGEVSISKLKGAINQAILAIHPHEDYDSQFLMQWLRKSKENIIGSYLQGGQGNLSGNIVKQLLIDVPTYEEQKKIGAYFEHLDNLITLHQRKADTYKKLKKCMLQKMVPKDGETVPEIRFPKFTESWERRKVSEMFIVTRGYVLPVAATSEVLNVNMPYPVYSSQTKDNGLMGYYSDYLYEDAITWTTDGANAGTVNFRNGKFYCTNVCGVLLSDKVEANKIVAETLNNVAKKYVSYVGNPKLMNNIMADIKLTISTSREERAKISAYFSALDNLIGITQQKVDVYKRLKKCMLQKMFI